jgi:hypothetical protein
MVENGAESEHGAYFKSLLVNAKEQIKLLLTQARDHNVRSYYSIATTAHGSSTKPYLTPIRFLESGVIGGAVVYSQSQAIQIASLLDSDIDYVLVDSEKKIDIQVDSRNDAVSPEGTSHENPIRKTRGEVDVGNVSAAVRSVLGNSKIIEFKPNDITVDAVWSYLSLSLKNLSGMKMAIMGAGNIGFKLALKLVECGVNVELVRRDANKGNLMASAINIIKPKNTMAKASYNESALQAAVFCDVLIGTSAGSPVITWEMIQCMAPNGIVLDVGKGSICEDAIESALKDGVTIIRSDISAALYGFISQKQRMQTTLENHIGKRNVGEITVVAGGMFGREGDVVVDSISNPRFIQGVADGRGDLKRVLSKADSDSINKVKEYFQFPGSRPE